MQQDTSFCAALAFREQYRDDYLRKHDPIAEDRLLWRAHTFRHAVHLLPGQTILELGCGEGFFTRALLRTLRSENPITAVTFQPRAKIPSNIESRIELLTISDLPGPLDGRGFDYVIAMDLLDGRYAARFFRAVSALLAPEGELVFYESNPGNPILKLRRLLLQVLGRPDPRLLLSRCQICDLVSETGLMCGYAIYNDFVFSPLTRRLIWLLRNLSILLENAPGVRTMAGSIFLHAQKSPQRKHKPSVPLFARRPFRGAVSFVIPCHNEEMNVRSLVERILDLYGDYVHEIILVNDGSTDRTAAVIEEIASRDARIKPLHRNPPSGVGRALADGLSQASGLYVLSMDCDFEHLLPELRDLFDTAFEGYDVVIGSRFSRHSVLLNYPFLKIVANRGFHLLARLLLLRKFRDLTNNLKLMRREVVRDLQLSQPGFAVNAETGLQPLIMGYRVKEVPISWINRFPGMGSSSFDLVRAGGGYWRVLFDIWLKQLFGLGRYRNLGRQH